MRPTCNDCGTRLSGPVENDRTVCPGCGRTWTLSPDREHIQITLRVESGRLGPSSKIQAR